MRNLPAKLFKFLPYARLRGAGLGRHIMQMKLANDPFELEGYLRVRFALLFGGRISHRRLEADNCALS